MTFSTGDWASAFIHEAEESLTDRYYVVVANGDLQVFDRVTGGQYSVTFPDGKSYLTTVNGFKAITVGETTYLVNKDVAVRRSNVFAPAQVPQALITVREADYGVTFTVTLDTFTASYTAPPGTSPLSSPSLATDIVATQLASNLVATTGGVSTPYTIQVFGSTIWIQRADKKDFTIKVTDGLSNAALRLIKDTTQNFTDLPDHAVNGMIVKIAGDPESTVDDYWVQFVSQSSPSPVPFGVPTAGIWQEVAAPGTPIGLDPVTMPWTLTKGVIQTDGLVASRQIKMPTVTPITTAAFSSGYTSNTRTTTTYSGVESVQISADTDILSITAGTGAGALRSVFTYFDVDCTRMDVGTQITLTFYKNGVAAQAKTFDAGTVVQNESLLFSGTVTGGDVFTLELRYSSLTTPTNVALVTAHGSTGAKPGFLIAFLSKYSVAFGQTDPYPMGVVVTLTLNSTAYTHTALSVDETGLSMANAFVALLPGGTYTVVNGSDGTFTVANASGAPITWSIVPSFTFDPRFFFSPNVTFTPGTLIGQTLVDDTDGSSGTIIANSAHCIQTAAMSGGIFDAIADGDSLHIVGTPDSTTTFIFAPAVWGTRQGGDLTTCPLPSFVDQEIEEIFSYRNRLGLTAKGFVVCSQAGVYTNFMRQTATQLLPDDPIDIKSAHPNAGDMMHATEWDELLYLFTSSGKQFALTGGGPEDTLTPQTVSLPLKASFPVSPQVRPIAMGKYLYFARAKSSFAEIDQMFTLFNGRVDSKTITESVPKYIPGKPLLLAGDPTIEMLFCVADGAPDTLFVRSFHYDEETSGYGQQTLTQESWSKWTFPGVTNILAISCTDGLLALLLLRSDGAYLETIDIGVIPDGAASYKDRQGSGSEVSFTSTYQLSTIYMRDNQDAPETRGRLQLRYGTLNFDDTKGFTVTVTPQGRTPFTYPYTSAAITSGQSQFPILTKNEYATVTITNNGDVGFAFSGFDWEGDYTTRDKRL